MLQCVPTSRPEYTPVRGGAQIPCTSQDSASRKQPATVAAASTRTSQTQAGTHRCTPRSPLTTHHNRSTTYSCITINLDCLILCVTHRLAGFATPECPTHPRKPKCATKQKKLESVLHIHGSPTTTSTHVLCRLGLERCDVFLSLADISHAATLPTTVMLAVHSQRNSWQHAHSNRHTHQSS